MNQITELNQTQPVLGTHNNCIFITQIQDYEYELSQAVEPEESSTLMVYLCLYLCCLDRLGRDSRGTYKDACRWSPEISRTAFTMHAKLTTCTRKGTALLIVWLSSWFVTYPIDVPDHSLDLHPSVQTLDLLNCHGRQLALLSQNRPLPPIFCINKCSLSQPLNYIGNRLSPARQVKVCKTSCLNNRTSLLGGYRL